MTAVIQGYQAPPRQQTDELNRSGTGVTDTPSTVAATPGVPSGPLQYDVSDAIEAIGFGPAQILLMFQVSAIWVADAMEMMMLSFLTPALACEWKLTNSEKATITTVVFIGMGIGAPFWGWFDDKYGRKQGYFLCVLVTAVAGLATAGANGLWMLLLCRCVVGFGASGSHVCVTLFSEFLPTRWRAFGVLMVGVFWAAGAVLEALLAYAVMPSMDPGTGWRVLLALSAAPLFVLMLLYPWMPESPRWDALHGNMERAESVLARAAERNGKQLPAGKLVPLSQLHQMQQAKAAKATVKDLFSPSLRLTTLLLLPMWFATAMSYYGVVLLNTELFQEEDEGARCPDPSRIVVHENLSAPAVLDSEPCSHLKTEDYRDALIDAVAEVPGLFVCFLFIDRIGRKGTMAGGYGVAALAFGALMFCWTRGAENVWIFAARGAVAGVFQVIFLYTPEVFPTSLRARAMGTCSSFSRIGGMLTPFVSDVILPIDSRLALGIYAALVLVAAIAACCLPIETAGKQIQESLGHAPPPAPPELPAGQLGATRYTSLAGQQAAQPPGQHAQYAVEIALLAEAGSGSGNSTIV
eukprot:TRINITY_DN14314_c0_g1_i1.p1 TRINITY_DN14314_c0_g1~~TRINITY_DN14314_c0_g1_i1.p1  ORF type:complete len:580 (+),score=61.81 TRINITY_DN14314_c0_g1_i1:51-1790(+)